MNFTNDEIMNEINKSINKKTYTPDFIPDGYKVKQINTVQHFIKLSQVKRW